MENKSGIYCIQSKIYPERIYIGSSNILSHRKNQHFSDLRKKKHGSIKLQNHVNKYGIDDLLFFIVDFCCKEDLIKNEQFYLDILNPYFNIREIAESNYGKIVSEDNRSKMSDSMVKKWEDDSFRNKITSNLKNLWTDELYRKNMIEKHTGIIVSDETRNKMRISSTGRKQSEESIKKSADKRRGRKATDETRERNRIAATGRTMSDETKLKLSIAKTGRVVSDETKQKLSIASKNFNYSEKKKQRIKTNGSSSYWGVTKLKDRDKWQVNIKINRRDIYLGRFNSEIEAAIVYNEYVENNKLNNKTLNIIPEEYAQRETA